VAIGIPIGVSGGIVLRNQHYARFNDDRKNIKEKLEQQDPIVYRNIITLLS
jgi:hypothetical protein